MIRRLIFFALLGLGPLASAAEREEVRVFPVRPGCTVKLDTHRGAVVITESSEPVVHVLVQMEIGADSAAEADALRAGLRLEMNAADNTVTITARNPRESRALWVWREDKQIGLTFRIALPRRANLDATVLRGSVVVGDLDGSVRARVETGTISCRHIAGAVDVATDDGDIVVSRGGGALSARTRRGTIRTGAVAGRIEARSASGDIEILEARGPVVATAEAGDVTVGFPRAVGGEATLTAHGGNVRAKIDPAAAVRIEATSVWGDVASRLPLAIEAGANGRNRLVGRLGAGGPRIVAHASGGYVRLEPGETLFE